MTDKRILKTKQALKSTLIEMMKKQPFQKIKVKDLCEEANTSKLTFYTHYDDKYALLQEVAEDMVKEVMAKYSVYQSRSPEPNDIVKHNHNLLRAIIYVQDKYAQVFETAEMEKSYSFFLFFYEVLIDAFSNEEKFLVELVKTNYPIKAFSAFLITGMWGYTYVAKKEGIPDKQLYNQLLSLAEDISKSNLFFE